MSANLDDSDKSVKVDFGEHTRVAETAIMPADVSPKKIVDDKFLKASSNFESEKNSIEQIRDGINLNVLDFTPNENMECRFTAYHSPMFFKILLSTNCKIDYLAHKKNVYEYTTPQAFFGKNINSFGTFYVQKRTLFQMITIAFTDEAIATLLHSCAEFGCRIICCQARRSDSSYRAFRCWEKYGYQAGGKILGY